MSEHEPVQADSPATVTAYPERPADEVPEVFPIEVWWALDALFGRLNAGTMSPLDIPWTFHRSEAYSNVLDVLERRVFVEAYRMAHEAGDAAACDVLRREWSHYKLARFTLRDDVPALIDTFEIERGRVTNTPERVGRVAEILRMLRAALPAASTTVRETDDDGGIVAASFVN